MLLHFCSPRTPERRGEGDFIGVTSPPSTPALSHPRLLRQPTTPSFPSILLLLQVRFSLEHIAHWRWINQAISNYWDGMRWFMQNRVPPSLYSLLVLSGNGSSAKVCHAPALIRFLSLSLSSLSLFLSLSLSLSLSHTHTHTHTHTHDHDFRGAISEKLLSPLRGLVLMSIHR